MANLDFSPLYRSTVGFDRLARLLSSTAEAEDDSVTFPPYDIERTSDGGYRIVIALAGFNRDDIEIVVAQNLLTISGRLPKADDVEYLHRGIAGRSFKRQFDLADFINVEGASFENGLLVVELTREVPEALKPKTIKIGSNGRGRTVKAANQNAA